MIGCFALFIAVCLIVLPDLVESQTIGSQFLCSQSDKAERERFFDFDCFFSLKQLVVLAMPFLETGVLGA